MKNHIFLSTEDKSMHHIIQEMSETDCNQDPENGSFRRYFVLVHLSEYVTYRYSEILHVPPTLPV